MSAALSRQLEDLAHELDMVVFRLERTASEDREQLERERKRLRKDVESVRDQLRDLSLGL